MKALRNLFLLIVLVLAVAAMAGHSLIAIPYLPSQAPSISLSSLQKSGSSLISSLNKNNPLAHASSGDSVEGQPTVTAGFINQVLAAYHSPAQGTGQALYDGGVKYGIDPVYALAFFQHESTFGTTGVARVSLSLGNIRCTAGYACTGGYRAYGSWPEGYEDWYKLIRNLYISQWHLSTVEQIIPVYAPASDHNDVPGYIAAINTAVRTWRAGEVQS